MRTWISGFALALLAAACEPAPPVFLELPDLGDSQTVVMAVEQGPSVQLRAMQATDFPREYEDAFGLDEDAPIRISLAGYRESLDELGLAPGVLRDAPEPNLRLDELEAVAAYSASVDGREVAPFVAGALSPRIASLRLPLSVMCPDFVQEPVEDERTAAKGLASLSTERAVGLTTREVLVFDELGVVASHALPSGETGYALHRAENDQLWVMTSSAIYRAQLEPFELTPVVQKPAASATALAVLDDGGEILTFNTRGELWRHQGADWERIHVASPEQFREGIIGQPRLHAANGEVFAGGDDYVVLLTYSDGVVEESMPGGQLPTKGYMAFLDRGEETWSIDIEVGSMYARRSGRWQSAFESMTNEIYAMSPYADGILLGSKVGTTRVVFPERDFFCPELRSARVNLILDLAPLGDAFLVRGAFDELSNGWAYLRKTLR